ncbi:DUF397 domain-containing protein [Streptomonospora sp. S1-112]|uniref:DUF397 domain-containing protein n=1 Tax=Streptomonospora mangrovi TaxID=2883123 RepID=A0A9X3SGJ4_9ACTN|nr:DUF397 domain-containing protein [Streptomonospora mangrovi]MDA0566982.1 DUF397 domain-containing protein [Streptomonospora mangrovi]
MSIPTNWHKSSYSGGQGGACVEVAEGARTLVRDTQNRHLGLLAFPAREWSAFLTVVREDGL